MPESEFGRAWALVLAASSQVEDVARADGPASFALNGHARLQPVSNPIDAQLIWRPGIGWEAALPPDDPDRAFLELYLPICSATAARPLTVGHLGQSLDGFIATHSGESRWVTGPENILHVHRLRALCDAVIVGPGTVAADDPQLTTRLVPGRNPARVILDPTRRLGGDHRVFNDPAAETLYVCPSSLVAPGECTVGLAPIVAVSPGPDEGLDLAELVQLLHARGWKRIFVEGGGVTVSMFLAAKLLNRLHVAIAPLLIGDGRPAIRLTPPAALGDCQRPPYRVFRTGPDVLFDCELECGIDPPRSDPQPSIARVI
jgi:diaminohydroxyphosphoribosylaminopyrimidine deaminase/5-amino-6-(5-phosphoribosylamino)uracil reductase